MNEKFLLIKINELPDSREELLERVTGNWAIKKNRLHNVKYMLVSHKQEIVAIYKIINIKESEEEWAFGKRLRFEVTETDQFKKYLNLELDTSTSNPATTILERDLEFTNI